MAAVTGFGAFDIAAICKRDGTAVSFRNLSSQGQSNSRTLLFCGEKGTNRLVGLELPSPWSRTSNYKKTAFWDQVTSTDPPVSCSASTALRT